MSGVPIDPNKQLLQRWNEETDFTKRNDILRQMTDLGLFPEGEETAIELESGLYPDLPDPQAKLYDRDFLKKLLYKQEFLENRQDSILDRFEEGSSDLMALLESDASACGTYSPGQGQTTEDAPSLTPFELSPTQRFIGRFLSPKSPYNSALLFHGVGVGKTCSGITVAENFLEMFPRQQVHIVAPPTIQAGWLREIFNVRKLVLGTKEGQPNVHNGCTGNTYLRLSSTEYERDVAVIQKKVLEVIKRRYRIMGYLQFYNYITKYLKRSISKELKDDKYEEEKRKYLSRKFSGGMLIIDEAHNLRDKEVEVKSVKKNVQKTAPVAPVVNNAGEDGADEEEQADQTQGQGQEEEEEEEEEANLVNAEPSNRVVANAGPRILDDNNDEEADLENYEVQSGGADDNDDDDQGDDGEEEDEKGDATKVEFVGEDADSPLLPVDKADIIKGKKVTPILREVLSAAEGMKFLMLTATPMYNEYKEIISLLNLLLMNDKRSTVRENHIFKPDGTFQDGGRELLGRIASSYVSFMRGENPLAFPIRLDPILDESQKVTVWPTKQPDGSEVSENDRKQVINLPYVACSVPGENIDAFKAFCSYVIRRDALTIPTTDKLIMAGNFLYPTSDDDMDPASLEEKVGKSGFTKAFLRSEKAPIQFEPHPSTEPTWMLTSYEDFAPPLEFHSPKAKFVLDRVQNTQGVCFIYSRFVETGALSIALMLEANGYTCASRKTPLLKLSGPLDKRGRQCALCPLKENEHVEHEFEPKGFVPASYVLLTGEKDYSPNNKGSIELATDPNNFDGKMVKVILGSTIASEGIDLKFVRELFVFDSWYHLSKLEQVIGRGIRYKSHCALPPLQRNCTINLLVLSYGQDSDLETIDMYQYRNGFMKAKQVGQVTRVLKEYALDCNLNKELILIRDLPKIRQIDGQGIERDDVDVNDASYTNVCDWLESCEYKCHPDLDLEKIEEEASEIDYSTYDEYAAKWREHEIKRIFSKIFEEQPWRRFDDITNKILAKIPRVAKARILEDIVGNRSFRIQLKLREEGKSRIVEGYIIYKNGFYLFQPDDLWDTNAPLALRIMDYPVKRDYYEPRPLPIEKPAPKVVNKPVAKKEVVEEKKEETKTENGLDAEETTEALEEVEDFSQYKSFWEETVKWSKSIASGSAGLATPDAIQKIIASRYISLGDKTIKSIKAIFEMVGRLYMSIREKEALRKHMASVLLEFVWDEYLSTNEIQALYKSGNGEAVSAAKENTLKLGSKDLFRYVDPRLTKDGLVYICDGKPCEQSIIDGAEANDPISKLKADKSTTGDLYGLNAAKDGKIVFKSNDAVEVGTKKPKTGRLCYTVPNTKVHFAMLDTIGTMALSMPGIGSDLNLLKTQTASVETPARLCTLADLSLRLIDKVGPGGKRYFYRPISAIKTNHEGKASK